MSAVGDNSAIKCAISPYEFPTDPKYPWAWRKRMMANFRHANGRDLIGQGLAGAMKAGQPAGALQRRDDAVTILVRDSERQETGE